MLLLLGGMMGSVFSTDRMLVLGVNAQAQRLGRALPVSLHPSVQYSLQTSLECLVDAARRGRLDDTQIAPFGAACRDAFTDELLTAEEAKQIATVAASICETVSREPDAQ